MATLSTMTNFSNINKIAKFYSKSIMPKEKRVPSKLSQMSEKLKGKF